MIDIRSEIDERSVGRLVSMAAFRLVLLGLAVGAVAVVGVVGGLRGRLVVRFPFWRLRVPT